MFAKVYSAQPLFLDSAHITVEADLSRGLYSFSIVGLPDKAVEEARDRVSSAIKNSGFPSPKSQNRKVVVSLAPADIKKEGAAFDLPIALAYLAASENITFNPERRAFLGELSLEGEIRPVRGTLSAARSLKIAGFRELYVPKANAAEAALVDGIEIYGVQTLRELVEHLHTKKGGGVRSVRISPTAHTSFSPTLQNETLLDFGDIRGQETAKRGLEIAAAGRHNIVLYGPPGTGKTLLARAFTGILPPLSFEEALEVTAIHSMSGTLSGSVMGVAPFRSPHHTASYVALVGGGQNVRPGEITLAHRGVLFLDEFPEFDRRAIDALREPLEAGVVTVSRARGSISFPANFILIAAMNPSRGHEHEHDAIAVRERLRYQQKISGPIADRIDMWIEVPHVPHDTLSKKRASNEVESPKIRDRVAESRNRQRERLGETKTNSDMTVKDIDRHIVLSPTVAQLLDDSARTLSLSPRSYHRVIKLARTIADLSGKETIDSSHILEALHYRPKKLFDS